MPIQSSTILRNTGVKQDVKYWAWDEISPTGTGGTGINVDSNSGAVYFSKYGTTSKVAKDGRLLWTVPSASGLTYGTALDSSGNLYTVSGEVVVTKYSPSGTILWARSVNTSGSNTGPGITVAPSGDVYVATADSSSNAVVFKLNSSGSMVWARKISSVSSGFRYVAVDEPNDRVYAAGYAQPPEATEGNLVAFNLSGTTQWQKRFGVYEVTGVTFAFTTGVDFYDSKALVAFRFGFGFGGQCPIFKYTKDGALWNFDNAGIYGFWGYDEQFGHCYFKIDQTNGDIIGTYRSGSFRKYTFLGSPLSAGRFTSGLSGWGSDVDSEGNMYFIMYENNAGSLAAKVKPDGSGYGNYGSFSYTSSATSGHFLDNSMQSWEATASYSITSTSLTSTATSPAGITTNPTATFKPLRTK
jgi:hypothetical protein